MHTLWLKVSAAAAVLTLSGCIETVTKADGSTQVTVGPGVARKQMRDRDVQRTREQPATVANADASHYEKARKATAGADFDGQDWTPMFQLVEQGCGMTVAHEKLQHNVLNVKTSRNGKFSPQFDPRKLTPAQRVATGKLVFRQTEELVTMDLPITRGSYHGVPLNAYHAYRGTEVDAGISSFGLVLDVPLTEAKRRLAHVRFQSEEELSGGSMCENMRAELQVWKADRNKTILLCPIC